MIYLDYNATTPVVEEVAEAMYPYLEAQLQTGNFGNPSSSHEFGRKTARAVEEARLKVADLINASAREVIFTSGGSESNNMVIKGVAEKQRESGGHIITSEIEHPAVREPCGYLEERGFEVTYLSVDETGMVAAEDVKKAIRDDTILITIMHANNEIGTIQPIKDIGRIAEEHDILLHTDAAQSLGKIPVDVKELGVDFLSIAGHKLYAPKGVGALYCRNHESLTPLIHGAGHEFGLRAGTENVILQVGLGEAASLIQKRQKNEEGEELKQLTIYFYNRLKEIAGDSLQLNGHREKRLPNTLNVSFVGYEGDKLLSLADKVAASTGAACHEDSVELSPVLSALGVSEERGKGAVRFSLGWYTDRNELDRAAEALYSAMQRY